MVKTIAKLIERLGEFFPLTFKRPLVFISVALKVVFHLFFQLTQELFKLDQCGLGFFSLARVFSREQKQEVGRCQKGNQQE